MENVEAIPAPVNTDYWIAESALRPYHVAGSALASVAQPGVVLEEETTVTRRRVYLPAGQSPAGFMPQNTPVQTAPQPVVAEQPAQREYVNRELTYSSREDLDRAFSTSRWVDVLNAAPLWLGITAVVVLGSLLGLQLWGFVSAVATWLQANAVAIFSVAVGVPACLFLLSLIFRSGKSGCPGVTVHCPVKH
jgi:hypothetical protein